MGFPAFDVAFDFVALRVWEWEIEFEVFLTSARTSAGRIAHLAATHSCGLRSKRSRSSMLTRSRLVQSELNLICVLPLFTNTLDGIGLIVQLSSSTSSNAFATASRMFMESLPRALRACFCTCTKVSVRWQVVEALTNSANGLIPAVKRRRYLATLENVSSALRSFLNFAQWFGAYAGSLRTNSRFLSCTNWCPLTLVLDPRWSSGALRHLRDPRGRAPSH